MKADWRGIDLLESHGVNRQRLTIGVPWIGVTPVRDEQLPKHGWKIHISSRSIEFPQLLSRAVGVLEKHETAFKIACDGLTLTSLNDGAFGAALVGKAITAYPRSVEQFRSLVCDLADELSGYAGPRIRSDKQYRREAPIYYRYGPFQQEWLVDESGATQLIMSGPEGETFPGTATPFYEPPPWAVDPFGTSAQSGRHPDMFAGRYVVTCGLHASPRGDVLAARDLKTGESCIIKQARAHVSESEDGADNRLRLRNERRVLERLHDIPGLPRVMAHLRAGEDEYLVMTLLPGTDFTQWRSRWDSEFWWGPGGCGNGVQRLADAFDVLGGTINAIHDAGVVVRDISPRNVLHDGATLYLIDFGISEYAGLKLRGGTPGFSQRVGDLSEPTSASTDHRALFRTYVYAVLGAMPNPDVEDDAWADESYITQAHLAGLEPAVRLWTPKALALPSEMLPPISETSTPLLQDALAFQLDEYRQVLQKRLNSTNESYLDQDASLYSGWGGPLLVLLDNTDVVDSASLVDQLAQRCQSIIKRHDGRGPAGLIGDGAVSHLLAELGLGQAPEPGPEIVATDSAYDLMHGWSGDCVIHSGRCEVTPATVGALERLLAGSDEQFSKRSIEYRGCDIDTGGAHGMAGWLEALLVLLQARRDANVDPVRQLLLAGAATCAEKLGHRAQRSIDEMLSAGAFPMGVSWCQGLAGVGRVLAASALILDRPQDARIADACLDACTRWVPFLENASLCCGICGISWAQREVATMRDERVGVDQLALDVLHARGAHRGMFDAVPRTNMDSWLLLGTGAGGVIQTLRAGLNMPSRSFVPDSLVRAVKAARR